MKTLKVHRSLTITILVLVIGLISCNSSRWIGCPVSDMNSPCIEDGYDREDVTKIYRDADTPGIATFSKTTN